MEHSFAVATNQVPQKEGLKGRASSIHRQWLLPECGPVSSSRYGAWSVVSAAAPPLPMSALLAQCASRHQVFRSLSDTEGAPQVTRPRRKRRTPPTAHNAWNPSKPTLLPVDARHRARSRAPMEALEGRYAMPAKSKRLQSRRRRNGLVAK